MASVNFDGGNFDNFLERRQQSLPVEKRQYYSEQLRNKKQYLMTTIAELRKNQPSSSQLAEMVSELQEVNRLLEEKDQALRERIRKEDEQRVLFYANRPKPVVFPAADFSNHPSAAFFNNQQKTSPAKPSLLRRSSPARPSPVKNIQNSPQKVRDPRIEAFERALMKKGRRLPGSPSPQKNIQNNSPSRQLAVNPNSSSKGRRAVRNLFDDSDSDSESMSVSTPSNPLFIPPINIPTSRIPAVISGNFGRKHKSLKKLIRMMKRWKKIIENLYLH
jgi:hypothetical protein